MSRPNSPSWTRAKARGDAGEVVAYRLFTGFGFTVRRLNEPAADLHVEAAVEVKTDHRAGTTGNVAVEVACNGRPSGITTTTAGLWVFLIGAEGFIIPADRLRHLALDESVPEVAGGDGGKARLRLLPLAMLRAKARVVALPLVCVDGSEGHGGPGRGA